MKSIYIAPQTDIETLQLKGSVLQDTGDPGFGKYSDTSSVVGANSTNFEEESTPVEVVTSRSLWDE